MDAYALAADAAKAIAAATGVDSHRAAVVLGSGWAPAADALGTGVEVAMADLPGFPPPTVAGHAGVVRSIDLGGPVLVLLGRAHLYEGHDVATVVHGVRTAVLAGCRTIVLTNAAGSLRAEWPVGTPVLLADHLNLTGSSPLTGPPPPAPHASRFVDLTDLYSARLRAVAREIDPSLGEGVYAALHGPNYETPAEIRMLRTLGADLVGMSTALEAIAAVHLGADVLGISLVTNLAAGLSAGALDHSEVVAAGAVAAERLGPLLGAVLQRV